MPRSHADTTRHWQHHVQRWRDGSLSKRDYCREHALVWSSFDRWTRRLSTPPPLAPVAIPVPPRPPVTLIPVQLHDDTPPVSGCVVVRAGPLEISLPVALDADQARTWLGALAALR